MKRDHSKKFDVMQDCVLDNLKRGIEQEIYRKDLNIDFISRIYFSGGTAIKDHRLFPLDRFPITTLQDDFLEYHLRGIVTRKGRKILNTIINSNQD